MTERLTRLAAALSVACAACVPAAPQPSPTDPPVTITAPSPTTTTTTMSVEEAVAGFRRCLADNGVGIEEIPFDSQSRPRLELVFVDVDLSDPAVTAAFDNCSAILSQGALDTTPWPGLSEEVREVLSGFSECVRSHGVPGFPDPSASFSGVGSPFPPEEIPYDDPGLEAAVESCRERLAHR